MIQMIWEALVHARSVDKSPQSLSRSPIAHLRVCAATAKPNHGKDTYDEVFACYLPPK